MDSSSKTKCHRFVQAHFHYKRESHQSSIAVADKATETDPTLSFSFIHSPNKIIARCLRYVSKAFLHSLDSFDRFASRRMNEELRRETRPRRYVKRNISNVTPQRLRQLQMAQAQANHWTSPGCQLPRPGTLEAIEEDFNEFNSPPKPIWNNIGTTRI